MDLVGIDRPRLSRILCAILAVVGSKAWIVVLGLSWNIACEGKRQDIFSAYGRRFLDHPVTSNISSHFCTCPRRHFLHPIVLRCGYGFAVAPFNQHSDRPIRLCKILGRDTLYIDVTTRGRRFPLGGQTSCAQA